MSETPDASHAPEEPESEFLKLYSLAVEMADRVSARRGNTNAYFLSVQTTLLTAAGITYSILPSESWYSALVTAAAGCAISLAWSRQLRSYQLLNQAKFQVINEAEGRLPLRVFSDEWEILREIPRSRIGGYVELGVMERAVPWVFLALHILLLVGKLAG